MPADRYRITNPEPGLFSPAVKRGPFWRSLDDRGRELPFGHRWSGPLGCAANGIAAHGRFVRVRVEPFTISETDNDL